MAVTDLFLQKYVLGGFIVKVQADKRRALLAMSLLQQLDHWRQPWWQNDKRVGNKPELR